MTIDDLDRIRGKNERRREELESRLAEQCRHRDAMEDRPVRKIAALVLLVSLSFFESAIAAETEEANEPWNPMEMVALWPIRIDVEISPDGKKAGLTETMLYEAVELALRQHKIQIHETSGFRGSPIPTLSVWSNVLRMKYGPSDHEIAYVYHLEVEVWKWLPLREFHDWQSSVPARFWEYGVTGFTGDRSSLLTILRRHLLEKTDEFSLGYLRALE